MSTPRPATPLDTVPASPLGTLPLDVAISAPATPFQTSQQFTDQAPKLRWGLLGTGRICNDFAQALKLVPTATATACAAGSSATTAAAFAEKHGIPNSYGSYEDLVNDEDVDIVYVGNVHIFRREIGELCLRAGKHVLLEKPFTCTSEDARFLVALAGDKKLFLGEGMWTRYFPAVEYARRLIADEAIGAVTAVFSDFHFNAADSEEYPSSPLFDRKLAGGASYYLAPYPIAAALMCFPASFPDQITGAGTLDDATGVDLQGAISLGFPGVAGGEGFPKLNGRGVASLSFGFCGESGEETTIVGETGRITIETPAHCPTRVTLRTRAAGKRGVYEEETFEFPLPSLTPEIRESGGFYHPNSIGLVYEATAIARCIAAGVLNPPQMTQEESVCVLEIIERFRECSWVRSPFEPTDVVEEVKAEAEETKAEEEETKGEEGKEETKAEETAEAGDGAPPTKGGEGKEETKGEERAEAGDGAPPTKGEDGMEETKAEETAEAGDEAPPTPAKGGD